MTNWHKRFMDLALYVAEWSKYPGRHVGAVIAHDDHRVISMGYNGLPRGCDDSDQNMYDKNVKYLYAEHAERNAIYNARSSVECCTMYTTLFPCADCARAIIQSGIKMVVTTVPNLKDESFGESFKASIKMFRDCGISVSKIDEVNGQLIAQYTEESEEETERDCGTCKYEFLACDEEPCMTCLYKTEWTPKND